MINKKRKIVAISVIIAAILASLFIAFYYMNNEKNKPSLQQIKGIDLIDVEIVNIAKKRGYSEIDMKILGYYGDELLISYWLTTQTSAEKPDESLLEIIGKFNTKSSTFAIIFENETQPISSTDPFQADPNTLFTFPFENNKVDIVKLDLQTGKTDVLVEDEEVTSAIIGYTKIDKDNFAFVVNIDINYQTIYIWDNKKQKLMEIRIPYENNITPNITAITSYNSEIYVLLKEKDKNYIACISKWGNVNWKEDLGLAQYENRDYIANQLYVYNNTFFIKWFDCGDNPLFTVLKKNNNGFKIQKHQGRTPCYLLSDQLINENLLVFSTFSPSVLKNTEIVDNFNNQIALYDVSMMNWSMVNLDLEKDANYNIYSNEKGDIVVQLYTSNGNTQLKYYPHEAYLK